RRGRHGVRAVLPESTGAELPPRMDEVPDRRRVAVVCATGYRSSVAASLLARRAAPGRAQRPGRHDRMERRRPSHRTTRARMPCPNPRRRPMVPTALELPYRPAKPRRRGITMVIDNGLPTEAFR